MFQRLLFLAAVTVFITLFMCAGVVSAFHPLITDDAGTQGKGKYLLEINGQYGHDKDHGTIQNTTPTATTLTYGVVNSLDVAVGVPYSLIRTKDDQGTTHHDGFGDVGLSAKWRFYEKEGLNLALKPVITFPTGDKDTGLGTGRPTYSLFFITTKELNPWAFHLNLGYIGNENKLAQRVPLWHASLASEVEVVKKLKAVANIGVQRNIDKTSHTDPAFLLGGLVYSITGSTDIDAGYKYGLTRTEVDHTVLAGITFRF